MKPTIHTDYLGKVVDVRKLRQTVIKLIKLIRESKVEFDTIVFRGMSGALVAPIIALELDKHILMIRKKKDCTHSCYCYEGNAGTEKYIILDDCIDTGSTMKAIIKQMNNLFDDRGEPRETRPVLEGIFLYHGTSGTRHYHSKEYRIYAA